MAEDVVVAVDVVVVVRMVVEVEVDHLGAYFLTVSPLLVLEGLGGSLY